MGKYRVIYLDKGEILVECPVCKEIERNVIEPVALIVEEENLEELEKIKNSFKSIEDIKNSNYIDKILNKDDLVCIFHQKKEGKHWEEDTKEFEEWNNRIKNLNSEKDIKKEFNKLDNDNLINQFWERIRAYRFAIDYIDLWKESNKDWNSFISSFNINIDEIREKELLIKFYLDKFLIKFFLNNNKVYDFRKISFPLFFINFVKSFFPLVKIYPVAKKLGASPFIEIKSALNLIEERNLSFNFWYKNEKILFNNKTDFSETIFNNKVSFNRITFNNEANFYKAIFNNETDFIETLFNNAADFSEVAFNNTTNFMGTIFNKESYFIKSIFNGTTYFYEIKFNYFVYFGEVIFNNKVVFDNCRFLNLGFHNIKTLEKTHIEIRNSKFSEFNLINIINYTNAFFISNVEIITLKEFKQETNQNSETNKKEKQEKINIKNSILNNVKFINCNFSQAKKIEIKDSYLEETIFANVNWGKISEKRICPELFEDKPDKARDIYRQIKLALEKQADYINANWFYALEMRAYEEYLNKMCIKDKVFKLGDFFVFKFHKLISNFGQSIFKPFILILILTSIMLGFRYSYFEKIKNSIPINIYFIPLENLVFLMDILKGYIFFYLPYFSILQLSIKFIIYYYLILLTLIFIINITLCFQSEKIKSFLEKIKKFFYSLLKIPIISILIILVIEIYIEIYYQLIGLGLKKDLEMIAHILDNFATTLNIFNVFKIFSKDEQGNFANAPHYFNGYYFIYKLYAISILVLIYQLIVAIRRRVRR